MKKITLNANWIWHRENTIKDDKVLFRKTFNLNKKIESAPMTIGVDTKYWLYVNGEKVVTEGGLFREIMPGAGYADVIDIAPYLVEGKNVIALLCWYFGNEGRNNIDSTQAGLIVSCEAVGVFSDETFLCMRHPAYYTTSEPLPSYLYGGYNLGFDGRKATCKWMSNNFDDQRLTNATIHENNCWGDLYQRLIPLLKFMPMTIAEAIKQVGNNYEVKLPYAMAFNPSFEVEAKGGEVIQIQSDRYEINGGPGDDSNQYRGQRIEYVCHQGINKFESILYIFGEKMLITSSAPVNFILIAYTESGYDTEITGSFECDCEITNILVKKAARTLYVCMRDNFMDCPDRERGQWIGDVAVQVPQTFFLLSDSAKLLVKKSISDFINLRKGDVLVGNVPGANFLELPAQSLNAISEIGMIADYYKYTSDQSVIELAFEPCVKYLQLWDVDEDGLLVGRGGDWRWFDHLYNIDEAVLENAWYYSALGFALKMAEMLDDHRYDSWLLGRKNGIAGCFEDKFWKGSYYASGNLVDDRANALVVLSGLCQEAHYPHVRKILLTVFNSTVYMENYVLAALCEMGYIEDAYKRMRARYYNLAMNENSTLWEDFYILGTKNHAWSGAPATIAFKYFMGIDTKDGFKTVTIKPDSTLFKRMSCKFSAGNGLISIHVDNKQRKVEINNDSDCIIQEAD